MLPIRGICILHYNKWTDQVILLEDEELLAPACSNQCTFPGYYKVPKIIHILYGIKQNPTKATYSSMERDKEVAI
ncbi:hypothetical protein Ancab_014812 [Ancistrocladus abbreviatus]